MIRDGQRAKSDLPEVVLDLSRTLSRVLRTTPTGVDRVELTYALTLLQLIPERLSFGARFPYGVYGRLEIHAVRQFLAYTAGMWRNGQRLDPATLRLFAARHLAALRPRRIPRARHRRIFLQVSPHRLDRGEQLARILAREKALFVPMVHDLIPITHPEYARPDGAAQHLLRMQTTMRYASGVIANSGATRDALTALPRGDARPVPIIVAHLGTETDDGSCREATPAGDTPHFICIATIEPRKNHLLLLNLWKRIVEKHGDAAPELHLVGKRGWENEQVVDMLERCVPLKGKVYEHDGMSDRDMHHLLQGARALLLPSFAEGFGMPVAEALAAGVPVIASSVDALREVGRHVPEYLDPLDGPAWLQAIEDYSVGDSPRRAAQLERMAKWRPATWEDHLRKVLALVDQLEG